MKGLPFFLQTRRDWEQAVDYVRGNPHHRAELVRRLSALRNAGTTRVLMADAPEDPEMQGPEHFEEVYDPASPLAATGFSDEEIDALIARAGGA